jgi:organic radical activating enzyme
MVMYNKTKLLNGFLNKSFTNPQSKIKIEKVSKHKDSITNIKERKAIIKLGNFCNSNCVFCHSEPKKIYGETNFDKLKRKIDSLKDKNIDMILLSGGEATINEDFFNMCKFVKGQGYSLGLISNGRLLSYDSFLKKFLSYDPKYFHTSVHGSTARTHDAVMRTPGSFMQIMKVLEKLKDTDIEKTVNFVVNNLNIHEMEGMPKLLKPFNVKLKFSCVEPIQLKHYSNVDVVPNMTLVADKAREIINNNKDMFIGLECFPLCKMEGCLDNLDGLRSDNILYMSEVSEDEWYEVDDGNKEKLPSCNKCILSDKCEGIYSQYLKMFGGKEFKPIKSYDGNGNYNYTKSQPV